MQHPALPPTPVAPHGVSPTFPHLPPASAPPPVCEAPPLHVPQVALPFHFLVSHVTRMLQSQLTPSGCPTFPQLPRHLPARGAPPLHPHHPVRRGRPHAAAAGTQGRARVQGGLGVGGGPVGCVKGAPRPRSQPTRERPTVFPRFSVLFHRSTPVGKAMCSQLAAAARHSPSHGLVLNASLSLAGSLTFPAPRPYPVRSTSAAKCTIQGSWGTTCGRPRPPLEASTTCCRTWWTRGCWGHVY